VTQSKPAAHALPQAPQLLRSFWRFEQVLPQSAYPELQMFLHATPPSDRFTQKAVELAFRVQLFPQLPQLVMSLVRSTQAVPQRFSGELQDVKLQRPAEQTPVPVAVQLVPQVPQFDTSELRFTSHPLAGFLSQSANPEVQANAQVPALQLWPVVVLARVRQFVPQLPQLLGSRLVLSQMPLQEV
jgi:hypothetical protein